MRSSVRFALVGASGYVVNLVAFGLLHAAGAGRLQAATGAFAVAVASNFHWNRSWTFSARSAGRAHAQAVRFLTVSSCAFLVTASVLALASARGASALEAETVAIATTTPITFLVNRAWTFAARSPAPLPELSS